MPRLGKLRPEPTSEAYCDYLNDMMYPACDPEEGVRWLQPTCHRRKLSRGSVGEDTWVRAKPQDRHLQAQARPPRALQDLTRHTGHTQEP